MIINGLTINPAVLPRVANTDGAASSVKEINATSSSALERIDARPAKPYETPQLPSEPAVPKNMTAYQRPKDVTAFVTTNPSIKQNDALNGFMEHQLGNVHPPIPSTTSAANRKYQHFALTGMSKMGDVLTLATRGDESQFSQSYRSYTYSEMYEGQPVPDFAQVPHQGIETLFNFSVDLTTKEGDRITLNLAFQEGLVPPFAGFDLTYYMEGELSEIESEQLEAFANRLNLFSQSYYYGNRVNLRALPTDELTAFSKIDLHLHDHRDHDMGDSDLSETATPRNLRIIYEETELGKTLDVKNQYLTKEPGLVDDPNKIQDRVFTTDRIKLSLDADLIEGMVDTQKKQDALNQYLLKIKQNADDANASEQMTKLMIDGLKWLHGDTVTEDALQTTPEFQQMLKQDETLKLNHALTNNDIANAQALHSQSSSRSPSLSTSTSKATESKTTEPLDENDAALLTGLNDFSLSASTTKVLENGGEKWGNPNKLGEDFHFNLALSQQTEVNESADGSREIKQTQSFELQAAFHKAARDAYMFTPDFENQSYRYFTMNNKEQVVTAQAFSDTNQLLMANVMRSSETDEQMREYRHGELEDEDKKQYSQEQIKDVTDQLIAGAQAEQTYLMQDILLNPFE